MEPSRGPDTQLLEANLKECLVGGWSVRRLAYLSDAEQARIVAHSAMSGLLDDDIKEGAHRLSLAARQILDLHERGLLRSKEEIPEGLTEEATTVLHDLHSGLLTDKTVRPPQDLGREIGSLNREIATYFTRCFRLNEEPCATVITEHLEACNGGDPVDPDIRERVEELLQSKLLNEQGDPQNLCGLHLVLEEALMNAAEHGNRSNPLKITQVFYGLDDDGNLIIKVRDEGNGFDFSTLPDPRDPENLFREGGRGVLLIQSFSKEVSYNERGNQVTIVFPLADSVSEALKELVPDSAALENLKPAGESSPR